MCLKRYTMPIVMLSSMFWRYQLLEPITYRIGMGDGWTVSMLQAHGRKKNVLVG